jgi:hypothetical protein
MREYVAAARTVAVCLALAVLGACGTDRMFGTGGPQATAAAPPDMRGRWMLSSPGRGTCVMNFGGNAGAAEGTIAPEGGCPGNFFTSRRWTLEANSLVIRDHKGEPLARLAAGAQGGFDGQSAGGEPIALAR